jgi:hypothetical protein
MDSAHDEEFIHEFIKGIGSVIASHMRSNGMFVRFDSTEKERFKIRTSIERSKTNLEDRIIPDCICSRSRQPAKTACVLLFSRPAG